MPNTNTTPSFVFIVSRGERGEGSSILAVCTTFEQAKAIGLAEEVYGEDRKWEYDDTYTNYKGVETVVYTDGSCDYICIEKHKVRN